jgi:hypothetical protein
MLNYLTDAFLKAPIVGTIAKNPIYTALVVTLMVVLIVMMIFRDIEADETVLTMSLRAGFWVFLMLLSVLMIHNRVLTAESHQYQKDGHYEQLFTPSKVGRFENDFVPIQPQQGVSTNGSVVNTNSTTFNAPPGSSMAPRTVQYVPVQNSGLTGARVD